MLLGVNIDHVATLRQARGTLYPDPIQAAIECEEAGADAITMHLREDRRHIQTRDVDMLKDILQTRMNLEMAVTDEMLGFAERLKPEECCLVPENREELTTEGGLDIVRGFDRISEACGRLQQAGIRVSLFIDADIAQIEAAHSSGAPVIEIHTGHFTDAASVDTRNRELNRIIWAVEYGLKLGLKINAGHGLNYHNVSHIAELNGISELNIGHAIIARAIFSGLKPAVRQMKRIMLQASCG